MRIRIAVDGNPTDVEVGSGADPREVRVGESVWRISALTTPRLDGGAPRAVLVDGRPLRYLALAGPRTIRIALGGECFDVDLGGKAESGRAASSVASPETRAPMPGKVLKVETEVGARVEPGEPLLILEAMKMETVLSAEVAGTVREVNVRAGDMVDPGKVLVRIDVADAG